MHIALVGDYDTVIGFKLAGVSRAYTVSNASEAENIIRKLSRDPDIAIIVVTESIASQIRDFLRQFYEKTRPVIVEVPDKRGPVPTVEFVKDLIRRTVGVEIIFG
ncbi:MAG: V-type ATP synthase subunit F [Candidatus Methanomethylicota archaeon]|uniref:A-type ATP synthase subunit F n=1 Tax=Thermoproteota archaeon TaxID=2056631 RepID=A0A497F839_9CREN|nr:MAG: V-type ATP synthase subunit F [Candidatus Verstraetearchaeota archaeon]